MPGYQNIKFPIRWLLLKLYNRNTQNKDFNLCTTVTFVSSNVNATTETKPQNDIRPSTHTHTHTHTLAQKWRTNEITATAHFCRTSMNGGLFDCEYLSQLCAAGTMDGFLIAISIFVLQRVVCLCLGNFRPPIRLRPGHLGPHSRQVLFRTETGSWSFTLPFAFSRSSYGQNSILHTPDTQELFDNRSHNWICFIAVCSVWLLYWFWPSSQDHNWLPHSVIGPIGASCRAECLYNGIAHINAGRNLGPRPLACL